jgi:TonB family protein
MTVVVTRISLVALITLMCTFTVGSIGIALADDVSKSGVDSARVIDKSLPSPDEFIAVDASPVPEKLVQPLYPDSAMKAGIEGSVWVKALIDKQGNVRQALVAKNSGKKVGFEEAALKAAKQGTWKPAMLNNKPVAIWVSYEVKFVLTSVKAQF